MTGTALFASSRACASAPCRGGSNTTAPNRLSSGGTSGRRNRSRLSASIGLRPDVMLVACSRAAMARRIGIESRNPRPLGQAKRERADAAEQVGDRSWRCRHGRPPGGPRSARRRRWPAGTTPGGSATCARPIVTVGAARCAINSPWRVRRASRWVAASFASAVIRDGGKGPEPRTSMSMPASVAVTWMSSGLLCGPSASATAHAAAMAPSSEGASTGQRSMATM